MSSTKTKSLLNVVVRHYLFSCNNHFSTTLEAPVAKQSKGLPKPEVSNKIAGESKHAAKKRSRKMSSSLNVFQLANAEMGKVVVRFPPEPSGYLHIGHAKAALINDQCRKIWRGKLIVRFDDTNPVKGSSFFEKVIKEDLERLKVSPDYWTHSSDHFDLLIKLCEKLLMEGKAYVDDTGSEVMQRERGSCSDSKNRNNTTQKNLQLWENMKQGTLKGQQCCVRIKIDMTCNNGVLRDPTIYRCKTEKHPRTGEKYKVYPTYDFACPVIDSVEGVTHALRTMEFEEREKLYYFICDALGFRKPFVSTFSRLNMSNTLVSKRKLTELVQEKVVDGWDDPRMPTIRGLMRRGMTTQGLRQFIEWQGGSRSNAVLEWSNLWGMNKKVVDCIAPRYFALNCSSNNNDVVPVFIRQSVSVELRHIPLYKNSDQMETKGVWFSQKILIEQKDALSLKQGDVITFMRWGNMRVRDVSRKDGQVTAITVDLDLDNKDYKNSVKLTWLAEAPEAQLVPVLTVRYDHLITKAVIEKTDDWMDFVNRDSVKHAVMIGEPALRSVRRGDIIELQRKNFFICDRNLADDCPLLLIEIPDGQAKRPPRSG